MKKILALVLSVALIFTALFLAPSPVANAATEEELRQEIERLDDEIDKKEEQLEDLADKKDQQKEYLNTLQTKIDSVEKKVSNLEKQIQVIDNEIKTYENQLKQLDNEIDVISDEITVTANEIMITQNNISNSEDMLAAKLRASYINGKESTLKILMSSNSLSSFLTRLEMMKRMSEEDKRVINEFKDQVVKLSKAKVELEKKKEELNTKQLSVEEMKAKSVEKKKELVVKQNEYSASVTGLEEDYAEVQKFIADLDRDSALYKDYIKNLEAEKLAADKEIERIISEYQATSKPMNDTTLPAENADPGENGGNTQPTKPPYTSNESWAWPLGNASTKISSGYGNRDASVSGWGWHGGIDIVGKVYGYIYNKPIYASRSGTVIAAIWSNSGYGNYVVIDHGDGFSTVYAHCNSLSVTKGQYVTKCQHIANVGSTGNSTGNHLHFEVRYNGAKQDPLNYVKYPG